ncbi:glycerate kinase type-2 family protein [Thermotoga profunda]|uniref:glycerate kinase type-2 family protein n=1 Tax=Thermotoga profunda TaxID=1508420 RepID=UPI0005974899|nr:glycerate kinase [Thermotoga profunda]
MISNGLREHAMKIINETIETVLPDQSVKKTLISMNISTDVVLVSIGKAAWRMAKSAKEVLGDKISKGIVITKYGYSQGEIKDIEIYEAGHPVPDENTIIATERALQIVSDLTEKDVVLFLISGGGSALFEKPKGNITLRQLQDLTEQLLKSGASIIEINTIRKHLSSVKGGRFAQKVHPAKIISLVLSDVLGDRLDSIASGPAWPDSSTSEEALRIIQKYNIKVDDSLLKELNEETPKKLENVESYIVGSVKIACEKASQVASKLGYNTFILTTTLSCEAKEAGRFIASIAKEIVENNRPISKPAALILGGETVVHVTGKGKGGRNQELVLSAAIEIDGLENVVICSVGTDGTDGPTDAAGGIVNGATFKKMKSIGIDPVKMLLNNDSYNALKAVGDLLITGPTGTNVNDLIVALIDD